jgi:hypothetical protein
VTIGAIVDNLNEIAVTHAASDKWSQNYHKPLLYKFDSTSLALQHNPFYAFYLKAADFTFAFTTACFLSVGTE